MMDSGNGRFILIVILYIVLGAVGIGGAYYLNYSMEQQTEQQIVNFSEKTEKFQEAQKKEKEEILKKGQEISALIIDKNKTEELQSDSLTTFMPVFINGSATMIPMNTNSYSSTNNYALKIYADEKNYNIVIPESLYKAKSIGDKLKIKLYKDKIELME